MDILLQLETAVQGLLTRTRELAAAEAQARERAVKAEAECAMLKEENRSLRSSLEREKSVRSEAMARIDSLMQRIREHGGGTD